MKNPDWIREELILALDLYFKLDYGQMHGRNPHIIQLSEELRSLNIIQNISDKSKFRSVNSVALKLANFKKFDQNFSGKGMRSGAIHDREIWAEFHSHRDKLKNEANIIRQLYLKSTKENESNLSYNSDFIFKFHKNQEENPLIIRIKKEMVLANTGNLNCEICNFDSKQMYGELGKDLIEVHYNNEQKKEPGLEPNSMEDFIVVCCNCHKVLDTNYGIINSDDLKNIIKEK